MASSSSLWGVQLIEPAGDVADDTVKKVLASSTFFLWVDTVMYRSCTTLLDESVTLSVSMALYSARYPSRKSPRGGEGWFPRSSGG